MKNLDEIAAILDQAAMGAQPIAQFSTHQAISVDDAYAIQGLSIKRRLARGENQIGYKMGLTSKAKMIQVGVDDVIWGCLTSGMRVEEGGSTSRSRYLHPRVEPEIAFVMGRSLSGNVSPAEAIQAVEYLCPAIEIIDSRYRNFKFAQSDVVADNTSASGFVIGNRYRKDRDISNLGMILNVNGRTVALGSSAAILGHPIRSLVAATRMIGAAGYQLSEGDILLAGAATEAYALSPGDHVCSSVEGLGSVGFSMSE